MILKELSLHDWRNYDSTTIDLHPELNVFLGPNGQGKTNLLEGIFYLCYGKNFRGNKDRELVHWNRQFFRLEALFAVDAKSRTHHLEIYYDAVRRKAMKLNGVRYSRLRALPVRLAAVLFTPDDLGIIKGGPAERRRFIDRELDALYVDYEQTRHAYERVTRQRSELLRDIRRRRAPKEQLVPWNLQLVELGVKMIRRRLDLLAVLVPQARRIHAFLTQSKGSFNVTYQSSLGQVLHEDDTVMKAHFLERLAEVEAEEVLRGQNLLGPHRDDLIFYENGIDLRTFGSQGQQRTAILSMKLAATLAYEQHLGTKPLLLLDDVMSELDFDRQRAVMEIVTKKQIQTFITGTGLDFTFKNFGYDPVFHVKDGAIAEQK